jgi:phosphohistidine swiveling domain-containing protein
MSITKALDQITADDAPLVGGKAYNCARLKQAGFPVPDGFVVMSNHAELSVRDDALQDGLAKLSKGTLLAVRSSAVDEDGAGHSFAGIHETKLNVTREGVADAIRVCRASVTSAQAVAYRKAQGLPTEDVPTGVLVQEMVQSVVAGVAFTINPLTGARDELVISASWGLGEALVSGQVEPDEFRVRKSDGTLLSSGTGSKRYRVVSEDGASRLVETLEEERAKPSLDDAQLRELTSLLLRIEEHYGSPQDVEWCYDGHRFWIVQSRPVTTKLPEASRADIEWTRANVREVLPDLTSPQVLAAVCDIINRAERKYYGRLLAPEALLGPIIKEFYGRPYFNLSQLRHICLVTGSPPASVMRAMGHQDELKPEDEAASFPPPREFLHALPDLLRILWKQFNIGKLIRRFLALVQKETSYLLSHDPRRMSDAEIVLRLEAWKEEAAAILNVVFVLGGVLLYEDVLRKICRKIGFPFERLLHTQLATGEKSVSTAQALDILKLANLARREASTRRYFTQSTGGFASYREDLSGTEFLKEFDLFLQVYGHRGHYESDWALPRYSEDPSPLLFAIAAHTRAPACPQPEELVERQRREAEETWKEFEARLSAWQKRSLAPLVRWMLRRMKRIYVWRELCRSEMVRLASALRPWLLAQAAGFVQRGLIAERDDYFFLTLEEIAGGVRDAKQAAKFRQLIAARKAEREVWKNFEMPLLMTEDELPGLMRRATIDVPADDTRQLRGLCVSGGCVEGEVIVMREPTEFARMKRGAILVAPATDPSWTPLFTLAAGVIVEVGGTLSHASTVAREYGLPALANVKDATKILKDGDRVRLDATNGVVQIISRANEQAARLSPVAQEAV